MLFPTLETPVPLVDLDRMERNLDRVADYARRHQIALRPHIKTHKSPLVASMQLRRGAAGVTCATPREAESMSEVCTDILVAFPPIGAPRLRRLLALPPTVRLTVALDSVDSVEQLADAAAQAGRRARVLVEADVGMRRVGLPTPADVVELARRVVAKPSLEYGGLAFYPGHVREPVADQAKHLTELAAGIETFVGALRDAGLSPPTVSGGSTPTLFSSHALPGVTEIRPGTYVFNDRSTAPGPRRWVENRCGRRGGTGSGRCWITPRWTCGRCPRSTASWSSMGAGGLRASGSRCASSPTTSASSCISTT
jgi:D-serine deaminase-like pyridoxal phosphate-dependent protein